MGTRTDGEFADNIYEVVGDVLQIAIPTRTFDSFLRMRENDLVTRDLFGSPLLHSRARIPTRPRIGLPLLREYAEYAYLDAQQHIRDLPEGTPESMTAMFDYARERILMSIPLYVCLTLCISCKPSWRGPCSSTGRDRLDRQLHALDTHQGPPAPTPNG